MRCYHAPRPRPGVQEPRDGERALPHAWWSDTEGYRPSAVQARPLLPERPRPAGIALRGGAGRRGAPRPARRDRALGGKGLGLAGGDGERRERPTVATTKSVGAKDARSAR